MTGTNDTLPRVDPDPDVNWRNDAIQFPRLLAELAGILDQNDYAAVADSMDLTMEEVTELFERAETTWNDIKARTPAQEKAL